MSKLSKFACALDATEAAILLGESITENVTTDRLLELSALGYLPTRFHIRCDIAEIKQDQEGKWCVSDTVAYQTNEIIFPASLEVVDTFLALTAKDIAGRTYVFYPEDDESPLHINSLALSDVSLAHYYPEDIYLIAQYANAPGPLDWKEPPTRSLSVYCDDESPWVDLTIDMPAATDYNVKARKANLPEPPSYRLTIAALLELLAEGQRLGRNQSAIMSEILERHPGKRGLSKRNLETIFSEANKAAKEAD